VAVVPLKTVEKVGLTPAVRIAREYTSTRTEKRDVRKSSFDHCGGGGSQELIMFGRHSRSQADEQQAFAC
jgi:hypothetical protein